MRKFFITFPALLFVCLLFQGCQTEISFEVEKYLTEKTDDYGDGCLSWRTNLLIEGCKNEIPLIPLTVIYKPRDTEFYGLDEDSIRLTRLGRSSLYLLFLEDYSAYGSGRQTTAVYAILRLENGRAEQLFRDGFWSHFRGAWYSYIKCGVDVRFSEKDNTVAIVKNHYFWDASVEEAGLLYGPAESYPTDYVFAEDATHIRELTVYETHIYGISKGVLVYKTGLLEIDIGEHEFSIADVYKYCLKCHLFEDVEISPAGIRKLNNLPADAEKCAGRIKIFNKLGPIRPQTYEQASDMS